jgi:phospholipid transport system transporter-binding protein
MKLPTTATLAQVPGLLPALRAAAAQPPQRGNALEVDASALREFDTSLLSLLLQARREATAAGRSFAISGAPPKLVQLAALYGVSELLSLPPPAPSPPAASPAAAAPAGA